MEVGFLSGSLPSLVVFTVDIDFDTAGKLHTIVFVIEQFIIITNYLGPGDVLFSPHRMRIRPGVTDTEIVSFTHHVDGISQEIDEIYTLTINIESGSFDELIAILTITIRDGDGKFWKVD